TLLCDQRRNRGTGGSTADHDDINFISNHKSCPALKRKMLQRGADDSITNRRAFISNRGKTPVGTSRTGTVRFSAARRSCETCATSCKASCPGAASMSIASVRIESAHEIVERNSAISGKRP